jgi:Spy/CpxP family protein refolding chaperone
MARTGSETEQGPGRFLISAAAALALTFGASTVAAAEDASNLPSTWHVHDGQGATLRAAAQGHRVLPDHPRHQHG